MSRKLIFGCFLAPFVVVGLIVAAFLAGQATVRANHDLPKAVVSYSAMFQTVVALERSGVYLTRRPQINVVLHRGRVYVVNETIVPPNGPGVQFKATFDDRTLAIRSLRQYNSAGSPSA